ncbi:MAG: hypothetical protein KDK78_07880, partial [Chlamydiia bacterium]|nr:hypothetical protein [Chlamydiia bacterium]
LKKLTDVEIRCWDHLLPAFKRNTSLKHLTLGDFNRNQSIDSDLRKLLQHNTGIESLKLYHHFFNQSSLDLLTPGLEENRTLKLLRIGGFKSKTKSDVLRPSPKITCTIESE